MEQSENDKPVTFWQFSLIQMWNIVQAYAYLLQLRHVSGGY